jgi:uncharacterized protein
MKLFITGGTGFVGSYLTGGFTRLGHEVSVLTRSMGTGRTLPQGASFVEGDPRESGPWQQRAAEHDVIVNLAGATIFTLWTRKARRAIMDSRMLTTRHVVDAMAAAPGKIQLLSASAVGYYGSREDDVLLDEMSPPGDDFLAEVGRRWESEAGRAKSLGARVVLCRLGIILGADGGALAKMAPAFKYCVGSPLGGGKQWFPWIHQQDLLNIMSFLLEHPHIVGPVNCTAPAPVRNEEMSKILAQVLHRPLFMPSVPRFVLKTILGEFGDVLLKGQRAIPRRLLDEGFQFRFPTFKEALVDLLG